MSEQGAFGPSHHRWFEVFQAVAIRLVPSGSDTPVGHLGRTVGPTPSVQFGPLSATPVATSPSSVITDAARRAAVTLGASGRSSVTLSALSTADVHWPPSRPIALLSPLQPRRSHWGVPGHPRRLSTKGRSPPAPTAPPDAPQQPTKPDRRYRRSPIRLSAMRRSSSHAQRRQPRRRSPVGLCAVTATWRSPVTLNAAGATGRSPPAPYAAKPSSTTPRLRTPFSHQNPAGATDAPRSASAPRAGHQPR